MEPDSALEDELKRWRKNHEEPAFWLGLSYPRLQLQVRDITCTKLGSTRAVALISLRMKNEYETSTALWLGSYEAQPLHQRHDYVK